MSRFLKKLLPVVLVLLALLLFAGTAYADQGTEAAYTGEESAASEENENEALQDGEFLAEDVLEGTSADETKDGASDLSYYSTITKVSTLRLKSFLDAASIDSLKNGTTKVKPSCSVYTLEDGKVYTVAYKGNDGNNYTKTLTFKLVTFTTKEDPVVDYYDGMANWATTCNQKVFDAIVSELSANKGQEKFTTANGVDVKYWAGKSDTHSIDWKNTEGKKSLHNFGEQTEENIQITLNVNGQEFILCLITPLTINDPRKDAFKLKTGALSYTFGNNKVCKYDILYAVLDMQNGAVLENLLPKIKLSYGSTEITGTTKTAQFANPFGSADKADLKIEYAGDITTTPPYKNQTINVQGLTLVDTRIGITPQLVASPSYDVFTNNAGTLVYDNAITKKGIYDAIISGLVQSSGAQAGNAVSIDLSDITIEYYVDYGIIYEGWVTWPNDNVMLRDFAKPFGGVGVIEKENVRISFAGNETYKGFSVEVKDMPIIPHKGKLPTITLKNIASGSGYTFYYYLGKVYPALGSDGSTMYDSLTDELFAVLVDTASCEPQQYITKDNFTFQYRSKTGLTEAFDEYHDFDYAATSVGEHKFGAESTEKIAVTFLGHVTEVKEDSGSGDEKDTDSKDAAVDEDWQAKTVYIELAVQDPRATSEITFKADGELNYNYNPFTEDSITDKDILKAMLPDEDLTSPANTNITNYVRAKVAASEALSDIHVKYFIFDASKYENFKNIPYAWQDVDADLTQINAILDTVNKLDVFGLAKLPDIHEFGALGKDAKGNIVSDSTEKIQVTFDGNTANQPAVFYSDVTLTDLRIETQITYNYPVDINIDISELNFSHKVDLFTYTTDENALSEHIIPKVVVSAKDATKVPQGTAAPALKDGSGASLLSIDPTFLEVKLLHEQDVVVYYDGDINYKPCNNESSPVKVYVLQADSSLDIESDIVTYDGAVHSLNVTATPATLPYLTLTAGIDGDFCGYVSLNLPQNIRTSMQIRLSDILRTYTDIDLAKLLKSEGFLAFLSNFSDDGQLAILNLLKQAMNTQAFDTLISQIDSANAKKIITYYIEYLEEHPEQDVVIFDGYKVLQELVKQYNDIGDMPTIVEKYYEILSQTIEYGIFIGASSYGEYFGFNMEAFDKIIELVKLIPNVDTRTKLYLDAAPVDAGVYWVAAVTSDLNYKLAADVAQLTILQKTENVDLVWNTSMDTLVDHILDYPDAQEYPNKYGRGFVYGAKLYNEGQALTEVGDTEHVHVLYLLGNSEKYEEAEYLEKIRSAGSLADLLKLGIEYWETPLTEPGTHFEVAYIFGGNYFTAPLVRQYTVLREDVVLGGEKQTSDYNMLPQPFTKLKSITSTYHETDVLSKLTLADELVVYSYRLKDSLELPSLLPPKDAGVYTVKAHFLGTLRYDEAETTFEQEIKSIDALKYEAFDHSVMYSGISASSHVPATIQLLEGKFTSEQYTVMGSEITYSYYSDEKGTVELNGDKTVAPVNVGEYYVTVNAGATRNYHEITSNVAKLTILPRVTVTDTFGYTEDAGTVIDVFPGVKNGEGKFTYTITPEQLTKWKLKDGTYKLAIEYGSRTNYDKIVIKYGKLQVPTENVHENVFLNDTKGNVPVVTSGLGSVINRLMADRGIDVEKNYVGLDLTVNTADPDAGVKNKFTGYHWANVKYYDMTVEMSVQPIKPAGSSKTTETITDTKEVVEIMIPLDEEQSGDSVYTLESLHDGKLQRYTQLLGRSNKPKAGTFVAEGKQLTIFATDFSLFCLSYETIPTSATVDMKASHKVNLPENLLNGTVSSDKSAAAEGNPVTLTLKPIEGYAVNKVIVVAENGDIINCSEDTAGKYSFTMPAANVDVFVGFSAVIDCERDNLCVIEPYADTENDQWWHDGVHYSIEKGLLMGLSESEFAPNGTTTRAQMVTMLWRLAGSPLVEDEMTFIDVSADWCKDAIRWAAATNLVSGYSQTVFAPNKKINRQELAVILFRYAKAQGSTFDAEFTLPFTDADTVQSWATEAMRWCYVMGIVGGKPGNLIDPQGNATRAEAATMFYRFCGVTQTDKK